MKTLTKLISSLIRRVTQNKLLLAIVIVASILRFVGTNPGYNQYHADEGISYSAAVSMIKNGNMDPLRYDYPALVPLINYIFFKFIFIPLSWVKYYLIHIPQIIDGTVHIPIAPLEVKRIFQVEILGERNINALFWGRYVTALFSVFNVVLTYLLAKKAFEKSFRKQSTYVGLIAATLLAFNYKHVINSHIGLPDIYNAFFVLLTLFACFRLWKNPSPTNYLFAGISAGLAFSIKYQVFGVLPFAITHIYIILGNKITLKRIFSTKAILGFAMIPLVFILVNPYLLIYFEQSTKAIADVSLKYGMGTNQLNLYPLSYFYHIDYGPPEFILVAIGLLISIIKYPKETLMFLAFLAPFMFTMLYYSKGGFYVRNFITSTPILMIFASVAIWTFFGFLRDRLKQKIALVVLILSLPLIVYIPAKSAIINSYYYTKPWGYDLMRPIVQENLPPDSTVATHPFDAVNLHIKNKKTLFDISDSWSMAEHKENGADYALLDLNWAGYPFYFWMFYGFDEIDSHWNKPLDSLRNIFFGLATEEMVRYQTNAVTKPWQAPDTHLLLIKIPEWPKVEMKSIKKFTFDKNLEDWTVFGLNETSGPTYLHESQDDGSNLGTITYVPAGAAFPTTRITSPAIEVKEGYLYSVAGNLKTELKLGPKEREGFIRVDFYREHFDPEKVGIMSAVSSRVYGTDSWVKKEIVERAPEGAKFMTVSFQVHITTRTKIWLDDVEILESNEKVENITTKQPYNPRQIDLNYIYPNSHGNL